MTKTIDCIGVGDSFCFASAYVAACGRGVHMLNLNDLYGSDCQTKFAIAKRLYLTLGGQINNEPIRQSLERLKGLALTLAEQMTAMGFGQICSKCAAKPNGGCCSRTMTDENDAVQLLMNFMSDVPVALCPDNGHECIFLGATGCTLSVKPIFCLNYDCQAIKECANREDTGRYALWRGKLLQEQWRLEQLLLARLAQLGAM